MDKKNLVDWNKVETVLLDMDGTLLDDHYERIFWQKLIPESYAKNHDITPEDAKREIASIYGKHKGTHKWGDINFWEQELGIKLWDLRFQIKHLLKLHPHTMSFLKFLKRADKGIFLVTAAPLNDVNYKFEHTKLTNYFDGIYNQINMGVSKYNKEFWKILEDSINFKKDKSLLAEDNIDVLKTAKTYGIKWLVLKGKYNSRKPANSSDDFITVNHFDDIIP